MRHLFLLTTLAFACIAGCDATPSPSFTKAPESVPTACTVLVDTLKQSGALYDLSWKDGKPRVLMGARFVLSDVDDKARAARAVNCAITGQYQGSTCAAFDLLHFQTGKPLARFERCELKLAP